MKIKHILRSEKGNVSIILFILLIGALMMWQFWEPKNLSKTPTTFSEAAAGNCGPDLSDPTTVKIAWLGKPAGSGPGSEHTYRRIRSGIKIDKYFTNQKRSDGSVDETQHLFLSPLATNVGLPPGSHVFYLANLSEPLDFVEKYLGGGTDVMLYVTDMQDVEPFPSAEHPEEYWKFDVYLDVEKIGLIPRDIQYKCSPQRSDEIVQKIIYPTQSTSEKNNELKMQYFFASQSANLLPDIFNPHCKPLIYLYPQQKTDVHVLLNPKGFLTETIPTYPKEGWYVTAYPDGTISYKDKTYEYLYYESKIRDEETKIPTLGYVRKYEDLKELYEVILPKLGLNEKEAQEFIDYWLKVLPKAPYYFVGVMDRESIDYIEPLTITPKPDTIIRVRVYFKALDTPIAVSQPALNSTLERSGFTVVEWGGMVKTDKNHPFTCSQ